MKITIARRSRDSDRAHTAPYPGATAIAALFGWDESTCVIQGFRVVATLDAAVDEIISTLSAEESSPPQSRLADIRSSLQPSRRFNGVGLAGYQKEV